MDSPMLKVMVIAPWQYVVGEVVDQTDEYVRVQLPVVLEVVPTQEGLRPVPIPIIYPNTEDKSMSFLKNQIVCLPYDAGRDISDLYQQLTGKVIVPNSGLILPK
jgi:hypothetical protein